MTAPRHNANGHRRREIVARVLAEETLCALCHTPVDKTLTNSPGKHGPKCTNPACPGCSPHPMSPVVDEDIPRARGGSPYNRANTHLMHRAHNRWKGTMTLAEAQAKWEQEHTTTTVNASPIW